MASLKRLNELLTEASTLLNEAAGQVRDLRLRPEENVRRIGEVLVEIFDIQMQLHKKRPDLIPDYLKDTEYSRKFVEKKKRRRKSKVPRRR